MTYSVSRELDARALTAAIVLGTVGALTIMIVPGFVMLLAAQSGLDDRHLGFVASWNINAMAAAIGVATFLISRFSWRRLALISVVLIALGNVLTAVSHGYPAIVAARVCAGIGEGLAVGVSFAALGSAANPDRAFGIYLVAGLAVSAGVLAILPYLESVAGAPAIFSGLAAVALASGALLVWLPELNPASASGQGTAPSVSRALTFSGLSGVFLYFIAQGAMWSYFERIGNASGIDAAVIGQATGLSSLAGVGGALLAVSICTRTGRGLPLILSGVLSLVSFWLLRGQVSPMLLVIAGLLLNFAWNLAQPLLSGVCAAADSQGRVVVAMGCVQTIGFGFGPAAAALLLRGHDFAPVVWMSMGVLTVSLVIVLYGLSAEARRPMSLPAGSP